MDNTSASSDIVDDLTAAFAAAEAPQVDTTTPAPETPPATPQEPAAVQEPDENQEAEQPPTEQPPDQTAEETPEDAPSEFLTREQIEEKYARSNTIGLRNYAAQVSEQAREATETVNKVMSAIGGDMFVEPLAKMAEGLQSDDPAAMQKYFEGIVDLGGEEALTKNIGQAIWMGFTQAEEWAKNPETAEFGKALIEMSNTAIEQRFGVNSDRIRQMAEFDKLGWNDKFQQWVEKYATAPEDLVDIWDEFEQMLQVQNDPIKRAQAEKIIALEKSQQEAKAEQKQEAAKPVDNSAFNDYATKAIGTVNEQVYWKDSPLLDHKDDTPEMKETKAFFRSALNQQAAQAFQANANRSRLASGFRDGKSGTAVYQKTLTDALDEALQKTAPDLAKAEKILASLYGKTRNAKLVAQNTTVNQPAPTPQVPATPTVPTNFAPTGIKTDDQILGDLEQAFAAQPGR